MIVSGELNELERLLHTLNQYNTIANSLLSPQQLQAIQTAKLQLMEIQYHAYISEMKQIEKDLNELEQLMHEKILAKRRKQRAQYEIINNIVEANMRYIEYCQSIAD